MADHHPIFQEFERTPAVIEPEFHTNFMGSKVRTSFEQQVNDRIFFSGRCALSNPEDPSLPSPSGEDYIEWTDLLQAIAECPHEKFVMIEAGAGYGRWLVNAAAAIRRLKSKKIKEFELVGIEADQVRFQYMLQHFKDNEISPFAHQLVRAAVTSVENDVFFDKREINSGWHYGEQVLRNEEWEKSASQFLDANISDSTGKVIAVKVPSVRLKTILQKYPYIDLIDFDIQGEELAVIKDSIFELTQKVKRLHIGTHGAEIEVGLRKVLAEAGWKLIHDYANGSFAQTPYGSVQFIDGIQSWLNPKK